MKQISCGKICPTRAHPLHWAKHTLFLIRLGPSPAEQLAVCFPAYRNVLQRLPRVCFCKWETLTFPLCSEDSLKYVFISREPWLSLLTAMCLLTLWGVSVIGKSQPGTPRTYEVWSCMEICGVTPNCPCFCTIRQADMGCSKSAETSTTFVRPTNHGHKWNEKEYGHLFLSLCVTTKATSFSTL